MLVVVQGISVGLERLYVLIILDDFSRFIVGHSLSESPSSDVAAATLKAAIARHGKTGVGAHGPWRRVRCVLPGDRLRSVSRGGAYRTHRGPFIQPQGGGKVEASVGTLRRELWDIEHFASRAEAETRLTRFFDEYNERRAHKGIDGLTPADRFFGRADRVLATIDAISRRRQGALEQSTTAGSAIEENGRTQLGHPLEVLRLVIL
ncbi:MAG: transposase, partial [Deltaproteobacteria bacterium]|nr:transposase [Deltaproteobacteria bacterium]